MSAQVEKRVLVTGASGFIASHVVDLLLKRGYHVRGTVRSQKRADEITAKYPQYKDVLEFAIVDDIQNASAFDGVLSGITGVFHLASPFHFKVTTSNKVDLINPAVNGTLGILKAALVVPSIKRIVITSSFAAIRNVTKGPDHVHTENDWNPITEEQMENGDGRAGYVGSKKMAELAAWDLLKNNNPHFDIVTICPPMVYGPILQNVNSLDELNESSRQFYDRIEGKVEITPPPTDQFVDVRDVALAHILALENPIASNQRYFITNGNYNWQEVVDFAHKNFPGLTNAKLGNPGVYPPKSTSWDNTKSKTQLGLVYHSKEETFRDTISQLVELKNQLGK